MQTQPQRTFAFILITLLFATEAMAADLGTGAYRLPLVDRFAIYRSDKALGASSESGLYQLVEVMPSGPGVGLSTHQIVPKVESVAVQDRVIFGKSAAALFILDTQQSNPRPQLFKAREDWEASLRNNGISDPNAVRVPDILAAGLSEQLLRPWNYRAGGGQFGITDDVLSLVVQLLGFALAFVVGLAWPRGKSPMAVVLVLGLLVNVIAQIVIAGGGPGAFVGFVALPLLCMLAAVLGKWLRALTSSGGPVRV